MKFVDDDDDTDVWLKLPAKLRLWKMDGVKMS